MLAAGGFKTTARRTNIIVLRNAGKKPQVFKVDAELVIEGRRPDLQLQPYDVVYVPKSRIARVNLWIEQWITQMIPIQLQGTLNYNYLRGSM